MILGVQLLNGWHLSYARSAPSCPEIDDHNFSLHLRNVYCPPGSGVCKPKLKGLMKSVRLAQGAFYSRGSMERRVVIGNSTKYSYLFRLGRLKRKPHQQRCAVLGLWI